MRWSGVTFQLPGRQALAPAGPSKKNWPKLLHGILFYDATTHKVLKHIKTFFHGLLVSWLGFGSISRLLNLKLVKFGARRRVVDGTCRHVRTERYYELRSEEGQTSSSHIIFAQHQASKAASAAKTMLLATGPTSCNKCFCSDFPNNQKSKVPNACICYRPYRRFIAH